MKLKEVFCFAFFSACLFGACAQNAPALTGVQNSHDFYRDGLGMRIGRPVVSVVYKHFIDARKAFEVIASPRFGGGTITVLAEKYVPARRPDIYWYYGAGINAGLFNGDKYKNYEGNFYGHKLITSIGVTIAIGIEMQISQSPWSVAIDFVPRLGIYNPGGSMAEGGVSLKYTWPWKALK